jgi:hypothetical protein
MDRDQEVLRDIEDDLAGLIQDEGLTPTRLETYGPNIIKLFGVSSASFVIEQFNTVLLDLPDDKYTKALKHALGLAYGSRENWPTFLESLTGRRKNLMNQGGHEFKGKSEDTLRRWERRAMPALARGLVARARDESIKSRYRIFADQEGSVDERLEAMRLYFEDRIIGLELKVQNLERAITSSKVD